MLRFNIYAHYLFPLGALLPDAPSYSLAWASPFRDWLHVLGVPRGADKLHPPKTLQSSEITQFLHALSARVMLQHLCGHQAPCPCPSRSTCPSAFTGNSHCKTKLSTKVGGRRASELSCLPRCREIWEEAWHCITHSPDLYGNQTVSSPGGQLTPPAMLITFCDRRLETHTELWKHWNCPT